MKQATAEVYSFSELDQKVQNKVFENHSNDLVQYEWFTPIIDEHSKNLQRFGISHPTIYFNGFYNQGDGASFIGNVDVSTFLNTFKSNARISQLLSLLKTVKMDDIRCEIYRRHSRYENENSMDVKLDVSFVDKQLKAIEKSGIPYSWSLYNEIGVVILNKVRSLAKQIYAHLQEEYEILTSAIMIKAYLEDNDYLFFADGSTVDRKLFTIIC